MPDGTHIKYYPEIIQGTDEWVQVRCGLLTASTMDRIITPKNRTLSTGGGAETFLYELLGQRINKYVEPGFMGDDMLRGHQDEIDAKQAYNKKYGACQSMGFVTNDRWGFTLGFSPDALVGDDGMIECKSRLQKFQIRTILKNKMPEEFDMQVQTALLVSERKWCDFVSYCGGMHMITVRVYPDPALQTAIVNAARKFEAWMASEMKKYQRAIGSRRRRLIPTVRRIEQEIIL